MTTRPPLEPLGFGEILDAGFRLWRKNLRLFVGIAAVVALPIILINAYMVWDNVLAVQGGALYVLDVDHYNRFVIIMMVIGIFAFMVTDGATTLVAVRRYLGVPLTLGGAYREVLRRFFPFLGLVILLSLGIGLGAIALLVPGLFLAVMWQFAAPAFWEEGLSPVEAMRRSWQLVKGRWWLVFWMLVILFVIMFAFSFLSQALLGRTWIGDSQILTYTILSALTSAVSSILLAPLFPSVMTAAYFDSRVRKDGFDIQFEAEHLPEEGHETA